jgi:hypothetical protein
VVPRTATKHGCHYGGSPARLEPAAAPSTFVSIDRPPARAMAIAIANDVLS